MGVVTKGLRYLWPSLLHIKWHQTARLVAFLILIDQAVGPVTHLPPSEGIVVVALGVLFAPVPAEKLKPSPARKRLQE